MSTPSEPGNWAAPKDSSNPYAAAPGGPGYGAPGPGGGSGYPGGAQGYPGGPYGAGGPPAAKPGRPGVVTGSFLIWVLGAIVSVVTIVLLFNSPDWDRIVAEAVRQNPDGLNGVTPQQVVNTLKGVFIGVFVVFALLYLFFAFMMWGGRNWARIVLTVLGALGVLGSLGSINASSSFTFNGNTYATSATSYNWIAGVLTVVAIVLMFLPAANAYFRDSKAYRQAAKYR